ncbi:MAG TPA: dihydrolipoamide acetyltransferase family protein [Anaerolineales bacterium]|nr:dihydrolipoamide acetyltransferase family protein [Anaerolineales bacterium]
MTVEVLIPNAGQTSGEATIVRWLKKPGDSVKVGEALLEVETDKATMEVEATAAGVLQDVRYETGAVVPVLTAVAVIVEVGERPNPPAPFPKREGGEALSAPSLPIRQNGGGTRSETRDLLAIMHAHRPKRLLASPLARAMAADAGLELTAVTGSGPHGRIMKRDVEAISVRPSRPTTEPGSRWIPFSATRRTIAERMAASWREAPQVTLTTEADAEALARLRAQFQIDLPEVDDLSYTDLFIKIAAAALREQPQLNARVEDGGIRLFDAIHIGLAVDTERGLVVPVIREADRKGVAQIARERRDLAERARISKLRPDELSGGTFTLTNLGAFEIDAFTPIVNPPEGAVLGVGRIVKKPVVRDDELRPGMTVVLSLTFDHRLMDGGPAARFLQRIKTLVEKPHLLMA